MGALLRGDPEYSVAQKVLGCLLALGATAEPEFEALRESFEEPDDLPGLDPLGVSALEVLYGGGLCDFAAFDLRTKGEYHDGLAGLVDFCRKSPELRSGPESGAERVQNVGPQEALRVYLKELVREKDRQEVSIRMAEVSSKLATGTVSPAEAGQALIEIAGRIQPAETVISWDSYLERASDQLKEALKSGPELVSGLAELDKRLMFRRANLVTVAARTSHGKSAFCLHMTKQSVKSDLKVAYWCGEDYHVFPYLFASSMFGCPITHLTRYYEATPSQRSQADSSLALARQFDGLLRVYPALPLQEFEAQIRDWKPDVLVFDYVQKYAEQFGSDDMRRSTSKATSQFQDIARRLGAFGFMACQVKRQEGQFRPSRANAPPSSLEPSLYDLKESGDIENYSDAVLILHWPWKAEGMDDMAGDLDKENYSITIAKDKLGPCGHAKVRYSGPTLTFRDRYMMGVTTG